MRAPLDMAVTRKSLMFHVNPGVVAGKAGSDGKDNPLAPSKRQSAFGSFVMARRHAQLHFEAGSFFFRLDYLFKTDRPVRECTDFLKLIKRQLLSSGSAQ